VLAEVLADTARLGLDPGSEAALECYERRRRFDAVVMATITDGLNRFFSSRTALLRPLMGFGLSLVDRMDPLKARIVREAAGVDGDLPILLRPSRHRRGHNESEGWAGS
jgi:2-octaprenyl-6-methoxyphenol hydroxylase